MREVQHVRGVVVRARRRSGEHRGGTTHWGKRFGMLAGAVTGVITAVGAHGADSIWVKVGQSGRLIHQMDDRGDRIMDFSSVGYKRGVVPLPDYAQVVAPGQIVNVSPTAGDNLASIQAAIDQVSAFPLNANGFRGVVQLGPGNYEISNTVNISASGVILRGAGDGADAASNTILSYTGTEQINMVRVNGGFRSSANDSRGIMDKVVPAGATSMTVSSTDGWAAGSAVRIFRPSTTAWINEIGMGTGFTEAWAPGSDFNQTYERTITHVDHTRKRVFFDAPLADSIERRYTDGSGNAGRVASRINTRIENVGVEGIRGNGRSRPLTDPNDEQHADTFVLFDNVADAWARDVTGQHLVYSTVRTGLAAIHTTVDDARSIDPYSVVTGERRYSFLAEGQYGLMKNLSSDQGRHDFVNNVPTRGPNVFLDSVATNSTADVGPHRRWSTGTLFDNVTTNRDINVQNRWTSGTGHGWAGANMVIWNSTASRMFVQSAKGTQNWVIGSTGSIANASQFGAPDVGIAPYFDANNQGPVTLGGETSLYRAQLSQRLSRPAESMREYWVGDFDGFENLVTDGDDVFVDPAWAAVAPLLAGAPLGGLDKANDADRAVALTFDYDAPAVGDAVVYALLTLAVKPVGDGAADDRIWIDGVNSIAFADLGTYSTINGTEVVTLEFFASEVGGVLSFLQDGRLNLLVGDDHAVDWADLQLAFAPVPEPALAC